MHPLSSTARRGYLASLRSAPPLVYPFQYNPTQVTDTKRLEWPDREPAFNDGGIAGLRQGFGAAAQTMLAEGRLAGLGSLGGNAAELAGRAFSRAPLKGPAKEKERTLTVRFPIDGRERRPGEPGLRRNDAGDVLADLAVLRSFVHPAAADWFELAAATVRQDGAAFTALWFNQPPTVLLVLGDRSTEGYVTELQITETLFNADLDPVRADVTLTLIERIDSVSFVLDSLKRVGRATAASAYENLPDVLF